MRTINSLNNKILELYNELAKHHKDNYARSTHLEDVLEEDSIEEAFKFQMMDNGA